jgi:hypothetical protein
VNSGQRAIVGFHALAMLEAEAKKRQVAAGGDRKSEEYQESVGEILPQAIDRNPKSTETAASLVGVSGKPFQSFDYISIGKRRIL